MKSFLYKKLTTMSACMAVICLMPSCSGEEECGISNDRTPKEYVDYPLQWDESYHPGRTRATNESYEFVPEGLTAGAYLGELLNGTTIATPPLKPITGQELENIDISFDMPGYFHANIKPRMNDYKDALNQALNSSDFSGEQTEQFEYDLKGFSDYREMRLAFGANVDVCKILKISGEYAQTRIRKKTGLFARVYQKNFTAMMDFPEDGNLFKNKAKLSKYKDDAYINSISYGRLAIISIESNHSYDSLKVAFKASLNLTKWNADAKMDAGLKKILDESEVKVYILGGNGRTATQTFEGFDAFATFIKEGGEFSAKQPGVPIYITANRLDDNSIWVNRFDIPSDS